MFAAPCDEKLAQMAVGHAAKDVTTHVKDSPKRIKRTRRVFPKTKEIVCSLEGCNQLLATRYAKKCRVCPEHMKMLEVTVKGEQQRFCQKCSRFHLLKYYDGPRRSCRQSLYEHNCKQRFSRELKRRQEQEEADTDARLMVPSPSHREPVSGISGRRKQSTESETFSPVELDDSPWSLSDNGSDFFHQSSFGSEELELPITSPFAPECAAELNITSDMALAELNFSLPPPAPPAIAAPLAAAPAVDLQPMQPIFTNVQPFKEESTTKLEGVLAYLDQLVEFNIVGPNLDAASLPPIIEIPDF